MDVFFPSVWKNTSWTPQKNQTPKISNLTCAWKTCSVSLTSARFLPKDSLINATKNTEDISYRYLEVCMIHINILLTHQFQEVQKYHENCWKVETFHKINWFMNILWNQGTWDKLQVLIIHRNILKKTFLKINSKFARFTNTFWTH